MVDRIICDFDLCAIANVLEIEININQIGVECDALIIQFRAIQRRTAIRCPSVVAEISADAIAHHKFQCNAFLSLTIHVHDITAVLVEALESQIIRSVRLVDIDLHLRPRVGAIERNKAAVRGIRRAPCFRIFARIRISVAAVPSQGLGVGGIDGTGTTARGS